MRERGRCWTEARAGATLGANRAERGAVFEMLVVSELIKASFNAGRAADIHFWRDSAGQEADVLFAEAAGRLQTVEVKSGATFASAWVDAIRRWQRLADEETCTPWIVYCGEESFARQGIRTVSWRDLAGL